MASKLKGTPIGENISVEMEGTVALIRVDTAYRGGKSASGKSVRVCSTEGNKRLPDMPAVIMGINGYTQPE